MKRLMLLTACISLQIFSSQNSDWKMDFKRLTDFHLARAVTSADSKYFLQTETGDLICLNHRGNLVFANDGVWCEQDNILFIVHHSLFDIAEAERQEQLVYARCGNKESLDFRRILQAKIKSESL